MLWRMWKCGSMDTRDSRQREGVQRIEQIWVERKTDGRANDVSRGIMSSGHLRGISGRATVSDDEHARTTGCPADGPRGWRRNTICDGSTENMNIRSQGSMALATPRAKVIDHRCTHSFISTITPQEIW